MASAAIQCNIACFLKTSVKKGDGSGKSDLWLKFRSETEDLYGSEQELVELKIDDADDNCISVWELEEAMLDAQAIKENCRTRIGACLYK